MAAGDGDRAAFGRLTPHVAHRTQHVTADATDLDLGIGFVAKVAGVVALRDRHRSLEGGSYFDHPVAAGVFYPLDVRDIDITNSTASQEVTVYLKG